MKRNGVRVSCWTLANLFPPQLMTFHRSEQVLGVSKCFCVSVQSYQLHFLQHLLTFHSKSSWLTSFIHTLATATQKTWPVLDVHCSDDLAILGVFPQQFPMICWETIGFRQPRMHLHLELPWDGLTMASVWLLPPKSFNHKTTHTHQYSKQILNVNSWTLAFTPMIWLCANVRNPKQSLQASINFAAFFWHGSSEECTKQDPGTPLKKKKIRSIIASLQSTSMRQHHYDNDILCPPSPWLDALPHSYRSFFGRPFWSDRTLLQRTHCQRRSGKVLASCAGGYWSESACLDFHDSLLRLRTLKDHKTKVERVVCQIACPWPMITVNMIIMEIVKQQIVCSKPSSLLPNIPTSASSSLAEEQCCPPRLQHPKRCSDYCNLHRFIESGGKPLQSLLSTIII